MSTDPVQLVVVAPEADASEDWRTRCRAAWVAAAEREGLAVVEVETGRRAWSGSHCGDVLITTPHGTALYRLHRGYRRAVQVGKEGDGEGHLRPIFAAGVWAEPDTSL